MASYGSTSHTPVLELSGSSNTELGSTKPKVADNEARQTFENTDNLRIEPVVTETGTRYKVTRTEILTTSLTNSVTSEDAEDTPLHKSYHGTTTDHCHIRGREGPHVDKRAKRKLIIASVLCLIFMIAEIIGGILSSSLALATDAAHLLTDFASFMISLFALFMASRPATRRMSFGWHRAEVMGALISVLLIWVVTGILVYMAAERVITNDYEIEGKIMLITSALGVAFNIIMLSTLHDHGHSHGGGGGHNHGHDTNTHDIEPLSTALDIEKDPLIKGEPKEEIRGTNINVRAAFIHVLGDLVQSFGVLIASLLVFFKPEYKLADPICTFIFSVLVLFTTISILRDTLNVLMEGTPRGISFEAVHDCLTTIPGVLELHNLRIWSLTMNRTAVAVHLALASDADHQKIPRQAGDMLRNRYNIYECTIQTEQFVDDMKDCMQCQNPTD